MRPSGSGDDGCRYIHSFFRLFRRSTNARLQQPALHENSSSASHSPPSFRTHIARLTRCSHEYQLPQWCTCVPICPFPDPVIMRSHLRRYTRPNAINCGSVPPWLWEPKAHFRIACRSRKEGMMSRLRALLIAASSVATCSMREGRNQRRVLLRVLACIVYGPCHNCLVAHRML